MDVLLENDVKATRYGEFGTATQTAARAGYVEIVEQLLAAKADVNVAAAIIYSGQTALTTNASYNGPCEITSIGKSTHNIYSLAHSILKVSRFNYVPQVTIPKFR